MKELIILPSFDELGFLDGYVIKGEVVRCEDCRYANECSKSVQYTRNEPNTVTIEYSPIKWCSRGDRRSE